MATTSKLDELGQAILADAVADFRTQKLPSDALSREYRGPSLSQLKAKFCRDIGHDDVDFDLALKELEDEKFIDTGPRVAYENDPHSGVFVFAFYSKREFMYLTAKGYKEAQKSPRAPRSTTTVHISGVHFQNSPLAIGENIQQKTTINTQNDLEAIERLTRLLAEHNPSAGEGEKKEILGMVSAAKAGNVQEAKPIFQRLYGSAKQATKELAWALVAELIKSQFAPDAN